MQMSGRWKVTNEGLRPLHAAATSIKAQFTSFRISHIYRHGLSTAILPSVEQPLQYMIGLV